MTIEELKKAMQETKAKQQNEFIDKLLDTVENLLDKANKKDYEPTQHEREVFKQIYTIIINMNNWF